MEEENVKTEEVEIIENQNQEKDADINNENYEPEKDKVEEKKEEQEKETLLNEESKFKSVTPENKKEKKSKKATIILGILIVILLIFLSTVFALINMNNDRIISGIFIEDVGICGITQEEANNLVKDKISKVVEVSLNKGEYNETISLEELNLKIDAKDAIKKAITIGKTGNILIDNYQILIANIFEEHFDLNIEINEEKFNTLVKNIQAEIPEGIKQYSYDIKDKKLIITKGKAGKKINEEELKNKIIENIKKQFNGINEEIEIPVKYAEPEKIDIDKIYTQIYKEAKNAYIVEGEEEQIIELHKEENGVDFDISKEEAKQIILEEKEIYEIPLKITKPKIAVKDLGDKLFKQTLAKYTTIYDAGNYNRSYNIALAAKTINGTILLPGETFSYNGILGNTNKEKGYKVGTAYVGGKVVESYGGGICQLSSTLYNAALYCNLEIVERYNHSYVVNYVPAGRDATVAYGGKDFKFKNTRNYPIKIVSSAKNGVVSVSIMGIKEEKEYEVVLTSTVLSTTPRTVVYENNSALAEGTEKVIQKGYDGKKSIAYKIIKYNGKTISKTVLSKDTYKPMAKIVQIGTKKVQSNPNVTTQTNSQPSTNPTENPNNIQTVPTQNPTTVTTNTIAN